MLADKRFSASGRRAHICKACEKLPGDQRAQRQALDELADLVKQSNLSATNIMRLRVLAKSKDEALRAQAQVLLEVGLVHPHRSRRVEWLRDKMPDLLAAFTAAFPTHVAENDEDALFAVPDAAEDHADD